jgi:hypothetical protein
MISVGQNLVPNPSFENIISCDPINGDFYAQDWIRTNNYSPDYYNSCWPDSIDNGARDVPQNRYGFQLPRTGESYFGLVGAFFGFDGREYIQAELTETLEANYTYHVNFYVALSDSSLFAVNDIGALLSDTPAYTPTLSVLNYNPQIANDPQVQPLSTYDYWYSVSGSFTASGGEKFITIGNFKDDMNTDISSLGYFTNKQYGYYFIDDVSVIPDSIFQSVNENEFTFSIYPNPATTNLTIESRTPPAQVWVRDVAGRAVLPTLRLRSGYGNVDVSGLPSGIYLVEVLTQNGQRSVKKVVVE